MHSRKDICREMTNREESLTDLEASQRNTNTLWVLTYVSIASLMRMCHGLFFSIPGPTLQFLTLITNSTVERISAVFSGMWIGVFLGGLLYSLLVSKVKDFRPMLTLGLATMMLGFVIICTPFIRSTVLLAMCLTFGGVMIGYGGIGIQAVYLKKWGDIGSRPFVQLHHCSMAIGMFLAPLIAKPFLEMGSYLQDPTRQCPRENFFANNSTSETIASTATDTEHLEIWAYIIIGAFAVIISTCFIILCWCGVEEKLVANINMSESRPEEPMSKLWLFFLVVILYKFCCFASEAVYQGYIFSVAICSQLKFTVTKASLLNTTFWGGFLLARGAAILFSKWLKPVIIIVADLIGTTSAMTIMSIWGEHLEAVAWSATLAHGFFVATLIPSGVSWCCGVTNMTGKHVFILLAGGTLGSGVMLPVGGVMFQRNPFSVVYLTSGVCVANVVLIVIMNLVAGHLNKTTEYEDYERLED